MANPIEVIDQFTALIDLMKNPDKFADLVKEAKDALAENKKLLGAKATVEAADAYAKKVDNDVKVKYDMLEQAEAAHEKELNDFIKTSNTKGADLALREETLGKGEASLAIRLSDVVQREKEAQKGLEANQLRTAALDVKEAQLIRDQNELAEKASAMKALFK